MDKANITGEIDMVVFTYEQIADETQDLTDLIEKAYGPEGYGICIVKGVPNYIEARAKLLPLGQKLGNLPQEKLEKLEFPQHFYSVGWSHGKEKFLGVKDFSKGSFYANPQYDSIDEGTETQESDAFAPNAWPKEDLPELEHAFKNLGCLIVDTGILLAKHIDKYLAKKVPTYQDGKITKVIQESKCCKARLLHYFPSEDPNDGEADWCGWHNDHGTLTGLTSAMYFDKNGNEVEFKDPESGLFVQKRSAEIKKAAIPKDCLAFQIGESAQISSGGRVEATPHTVLRGKKLIGTGICRNTFAVFMQPNKEDLMKQPEGVKREEVYVSETFKVPKLQDRWRSPSQDFEDFAIKTLECYTEKKDTETTA